ncbi:MAG: phosphoethanolamine transferase domain-containing protein, partial [Pseudomonadales bacterium]|nr:phosphoethanolamine transferase domain-containing protein [Pseudomonadales bacterium]
MKYRIALTQQRLILLVSLSLVAFYNLTFFRNVLAAYSLNGQDFYFICSLAVFLVAAIVATVSIVSSKYTTKPVLILMLLLCSLTGYFMDNYGAIVDVSMLQNIVETN